MSLPAAAREHFFQAIVRPVIDAIHLGHVFHAQCRAHIVGTITVPGLAVKSAKRTRASALSRLAFEMFAGARFSPG